MGLICVSEKVKSDLKSIKEKEEHKSFDSVIRMLLMERMMYKKD